jgi:hypothetical protein
MVGEAMQITWTGHSTVLLELDGVRLVTDPGPFALTHLEADVGAYVAQLRGVDAVLISRTLNDYRLVAPTDRLAAHCRRRGRASCCAVRGSRRPWAG